MQQDSLFSSDSLKQDQAAGPVTCLGKTFVSDQARRDYFLALLAEKLKDPEFRKIEGFPIGSDEDILNLSDPPYYTACPNPWITDFVEEWESQKTPRDEEYHREPFADDVSEGKNDSIYNVHSYHTKVPPKAIMPFILHYTKPGDIVLDGFSGSGMTGIAAQFCGEVEQTKSFTGYEFGSRRVILNDLSPIASFISYNYNNPIDLPYFNEISKSRFQNLKDELGWTYKTSHTEIVHGEIIYTIWSELHVCENCGEEVPYWSLITDKNGNYDDNNKCPNCQSIFSSRNPVRAMESVFDPILGKNIKRVKCIPVVINYKVGKSRYNKSPDDGDMDVIRKVNELDVCPLLPSIVLEQGDRWKRDGLSLKGITHTHHFFTSRNYKILSMFNNISKHEDGRINNFSKALLTSTISRLHKLNRYIPKHERHVGPMSGTLYVSPLWVEISPFYFIEEKIKSHNKLELPKSYSSCISCGSTGELQVPDNSIDYIFTDPPFGSNLQYSELNSVYESWLSVITNNKVEAVMNVPRGMDLRFYQNKMTQCFKEYNRILKPGRWITVEFHNSKNSVWIAIQESLMKSGFVVSDVRVLDKQKGTTKQLSMANAVKQDLVISAYKPNEKFEQQFLEHVHSEQLAWDFVECHLSNLPICNAKNKKIQINVERQNHMLFDRMVAFYIQRGLSVPISAPEFYQGLSVRYQERDQMFFLPEQVYEYEKQRASFTEIEQTPLFIDDEASAITWLKSLLNHKPLTFQEIHPIFIRELTSWNKSEKPLELSTILEQNFVRYELSDPVPEKIHTYLSSNWKELRNLEKSDLNLKNKAKDRWYVPDPKKAEDLYKIRQKDLLKEFDEYASSKQKLKIIRLEAIRVGFKKSWENQDLKTIVDIANKIPATVLEEDPVLLMYYDQAVTLSQVDTDDEW